ncbi:MAG: HD domain-containing protein [bacterium]
MKDLISRAKAIAERLEAAGANHCLIVGGFVRDQLLGLAPEDLDLEVYGLGYDDIVAALAPDHQVNLVGQAFGIVTVDNLLDVSIPRRDSKRGLGHRGFSVEPDPGMTPDEAAARRDFTINSLAMDFSGHIIDPFAGQADLQRKILRATSSAFGEDPLRVLRGMQLAARFDLTLEPDTARLCRDLKDEFATLSAERIYGEWQKWAVQGRVPRRGLELLRETGWVDCFPALASMVGTPQDRQWHPEGDVFEHTGYTCDAATAIADQLDLENGERAILLFASLCHDLGKPETTTRSTEGRWISPKHSAVGIGLARDFLADMKAPEWLIDSVLPLIAEHMVHLSHGEDESPSPRAVRRLANRLAPATIKLWAAVCRADHNGRPPQAPGNPVEHWLEMAAELELQDGRPQPILMGRHLLQLDGFEPGPPLGDLLRRAFEAQLDGEFDTLAGALEWVRQNS